MRSWGNEFKQFLLRGNVVDLAVGIVIGAAFAAVVQAAVTGISAVIDPGGRTSSETGLYQDTVIRVQAEPRSGTTPYVRWGRMLEAGLVGVTAGGLALAGVLWWRRRPPEVVGRPDPSASLRTDQSVGQRTRPAPDEHTVPVRRES